MSSSTLTPLPHASRDENRALQLAGVAALLGALIGVLTLHTTKPLFGRGSIGEVAAYAGMGTSFIAFLVAGYTMTLERQPWLRRVSWLRRLLNLVGLAALHATFSLLLVSASFAVFADAFRGVALDHWAGTFWVALAAAVCTYVCVESALALTTESLSVVLAAFIATGALAAALSSSDPYWWRHHFSALGSGDDGVTFNLTLLLAGLALATMGDFLAHDLGIWSAAHGERPWRVTAVRWAMIVMGVLVVAVALIPVDVDKKWHDLAAQSIVVVFAACLVAFPLLFRRLPGSFLSVTVVVIGMLIALLVLWKGVHYLNTTAFEMGAAASVLVWLLLFVRTVTAAVRSLPAPAAISAR